MGVEEPVEATFEVKELEEGNENVFHTQTKRGILELLIDVLSTNLNSRNIYAKKFPIQDSKKDRR